MICQSSASQFMIKQVVSQSEEVQEKLEDFIEEQYKGFQPELLDSKSNILYYSKEDDEGNIEYKLQLINPTEDRIQHLVNQMKNRIGDGNGEAIYMIGVQDNGTPQGLNRDDMFQSLRTICRIANINKADVVVLKMSIGLQGKIAQLMVRQNIIEGVKLDIRILLLGDSGVGKSTLVSVLMNGEQDNGMGLARDKLLSHKHEVLTGATQTIQLHFLGFDSQGKILNSSLISRQG